MNVIMMITIDILLIELNEDYDGNDTGYEHEHDYDNVWAFWTPVKWKGMVSQCLELKKKWMVFW